MKVVVLTGAGISAESGVPTFRDADGLWEGHRVEDVATPEAYEVQPMLVHQFYDARRTALDAVDPNPAHVALARLEQMLGDDLLVVTQNVDDLHERGGSTRVLHMHGQLRSALCRASSKKWVPSLGSRLSSRVRAPRDAACCTKPAAGWTAPDVPIETNRSAASSAPRIRSIP